MIKTVIYALLSASMLFATSLYASDKLQSPESNRAVEKAQEQLQATFSNLTIIDFKPSPMPGLYEVNTGNGIIYFEPKAELLFFGEIYAKDGTSLTQTARENKTKATLSQLPMDIGLVIGDPDGKEIIEFTDPDCPYCRRYEQFIVPLSHEQPIKRVIYFITSIHPASYKKAMHVLCADNPEQAFHEVYASEVTEFKGCKKAKKILQAHQQIAQSLGISATPSFLINDHLEVGFQPGMILDYLNTNADN